jgi:hypothetical protein
MLEAGRLPAHRDIPRPGPFAAMGPTVMRRPANHSPLPPLLWVVLIGTLASCFVDFNVLDFAFKGYVWVATAALSGFVVLSRWRHVSFPYGLWVPWIGLAVAYYLVAPYPNGLQRTLLMISPIVIGAAVSALAVNDRTVKTFLRICRYLAVALFVISLGRIGVLATFDLPSVTGLAPQAMTAALLANIFAVEYAIGGRKALRYWILMVALPFIAMTRTAMVAAALTLPLTFAPLRLIKRIALMGLVVVAGVVAFNSQRVQAKMFYSGTGRIGDVSLDNPNFRTEGREWMWERMKQGIQVKPWFGHGANAQETFLESLFGRASQPHNDWLRLEFDYGYVGMSLFALTLLLQILHAYRAAGQASGWARLLFLAGASAFVSFAAIMLTDNIILYAVFFGNLQFALLGLAYAARRKELRARQRAMAGWQPAPARPATLAPGMRLQSRRRWR